MSLQTLSRVVTHNKPPHKPPIEREGKLIVGVLRIQ